MGSRTETQVERTETDSVRIEEFDYEQTLRILNGNASSAGLSPSEQGSRTVDQTFNQSQFGAASPLLLPLALSLGDIEDLTVYDFSFGLFGHSRWNTTTQVDDTGFQFAGDWLAVKWDRARYAIGIRELGVYSSTHVEVSEFTSVPFSVPGPIRKASLYADFTVPKEFLAVDPLRSWIEFFLTFDEGKSYIQVAPISSVPSVSSSGARIPVIVNVNSPLRPEERIPTQGYFDSSSDVKSCRLRVRFTRPQGTEFELHTPILRGYKIKFVVGRGVLS